MFSLSYKSQLWKQDNSECLLAWEPAVKCYKRTKLRPCKKDAQCTCGVGCSGMGVSQGNLLWKPVCYKVKMGINQCICGMVHNKMPKESCTWPTIHPVKGGKQDSRFYSGSGEGGFGKYDPREGPEQAAPAEEAPPPEAAPA